MLACRIAAHTRRFPSGISELSLLFNTSLSMVFRPPFVDSTFDSGPYALTVIWRCLTWLFIVLHFSLSGHLLAFV
jgi:hypothetical protein